ncbi:MAG: hypothetical protein AAF433_19315 [Bacteroidota bacterium]
MKNLTKDQLVDTTGGWDWIDVVLVVAVGPAGPLLRDVYQAGYDAHNNNCGCP